ncbi:hypothetical protein A2U01_0109049 [Trifolium medium]|uniref:Uncharacterized protein n=1 Tax=Trifolium medium TaxID=97028 RepID=A0A392VH91_9FABA|nr:hypothetical protein [Trifolium medium]
MVERRVIRARFNVTAVINGVTMLLNAEARERRSKIMRLIMQGGTMIQIQMVSF